MIVYKHLDLRNLSLLKINIFKNLHLSLYVVRFIVPSRKGRFLSDEEQLRLLHLYSYNSSSSHTEVCQ